MKQNHASCRVLYLISILLLLGQLGSAVHAADHPFHAEDEICEVFTALEKTGDDLVVIDSTYQFRNVPLTVSANISLTPTNSEHRQQSPRAPPVC